MKKVNFTAFDFETATYDRKPCQLGLVVVREGKIVEEKEFMIKPPANKYDKGCTRIHKITAENTKDCKEFDELLDEIKPYFEHEVMVGHNVDFDRDVLHKVIEYYKIDTIRVMCYYDTMSIYNTGLESVASAYGFEFENHHNALADARMCARIYLEYLKGYDISTLQYPPPKKKFKFKGNDTKRIISRETKIQDLSIVENKDTIFYDKKIVITGIFDRFPVREDLALLLKKYGANIGSTITRKTDYVIKGKDFGPAKMRQVEILQSEGYGIEIIDEDDLMNELINIQHKQL